MYFWCEKRTCDHRNVPLTPWNQDQRPHFQKGAPAMDFNPVRSKHHCLVTLEQHSGRLHDHCEWPPEGTVCANKPATEKPALCFYNARASLQKRLIHWESLTWQKLLLRKRASSGSAEFTRTSSIGSIDPTFIFNCPWNHFDVFLIII